MDAAIGQTAADQSGIAICCAVSLADDYALSFGRFRSSHASRSSFRSDCAGVRSPSCCARSGRWWSGRGSCEYEPFSDAGALVIGRQEGAGGVVHGWILVENTGDRGNV